MAKRKYYRNKELIGSIVLSPKKKRRSLLSRSKKTRRRKSFKSRLHFLLRLMLFGFFGCVILLIAVFTYFAKDLPNPQEVLRKPLEQSTKIYSNDEKTLLYEVFEGGKRTIVGLDEISPDIKNAIIAIEDKDFYNHPGIDFRALVRIAWVALKTGGGRIEGASTITQQFVKNSLLTSERTVSRKIKEIILSLELERRYTKDEILAFYLNQIPYGSNAFGIESASKTFFAKSANEVTLGEAAILAAIPKAQTRLSPYGNNPDQLKARQELVLKRMYDQGYITKKEQEEALEQDMVYQKQDTGILAPHFVIYVKEQLEEKYGKDVIETEGLKVYTTLDWELQKEAEKIVKNRVEINKETYNANNAALVSIDPTTGEIVAMVGSSDYFDTENDGNVNVALRERQPGSAFKPFAYALAFKKGYTPETILYDVKTEFNPNCVYSAVQAEDQYGLECYHPKDYDLLERGPVTMKSALAQSLNIPAVKTLYLAGVNDTIDLAQSMGITTLEDRSRFGLALVLGGGEVRLLDITSAFGIFANDGLRQEPISILRVEDNEGNILEEHKIEKPERVLDESAAQMINSILSDNIARSPMFGTNSYLYLGESIPAAAKTGTTQEYRDGWTVGYTPNLVTGVWTGNNDNTPMLKTAGVSTAGPIWREFMLRAMEDRKKITFKSPSVIEPSKSVLNGIIGGEIVKIDSISEKRATELTPPELIEERTFLQAHNLLYYVEKNNPRDSIPGESSIDSQYKNWEQAVRSWAQDPKRGNLTEEIPPLEYDDIHTLENRPQLNINSPINGSVVGNTSVNIQSNASSKYDIQQVDFFFDEQFLGSKISYPYNWTFTPSSSQKTGKHKITVKAYDVYLNSSSRSVNITTSIDSGSSIVTPPVVNKKSSLLLLEPFSPDPPFVFNLITEGDFEEIKLYYSKDQNLENNYLITKAWTKLSQTQYQYSWNGSPDDGTYYIYVMGESSDDTIIMSNKLELNIN